jgi:hypothetical protein
VLDIRNIGDWAVDVWTPLLALAMVADAEAGGDRAERIVRAARELRTRAVPMTTTGRRRTWSAHQWVAQKIGTVITPTDRSWLRLAQEWARKPDGAVRSRGPACARGRPPRAVLVLDPAVLADIATRYNPATSDGVRTRLSAETIDNLEQALTTQ